MRIWLGDPYPLGAQYDGAGTNFLPFFEVAGNDDESARYMPKSVVINPYFDWGDDRSPCTPYHGTVIYEAHVKGLTARNPHVMEPQRGTYAGLAAPEMIDYFRVNGDAITELDRRGDPVRDASFLLLVNASDDDLTFVLPEAHRGMWTSVLDTTTSYALENEETALVTGDEPKVEARSIQVLRHV